MTILAIAERAVRSWAPDARLAFCQAVLTNPDEFAAGDVRAGEVHLSVQVFHDRFTRGLPWPPHAETTEARAVEIGEPPADIVELARIAARIGVDLALALRPRRA